ncbi:MAG: exodeoxyribonuclease VII large subunit [Thermodesulfobacteriota bacterium]
MHNPHPTAERKIFTVSELTSDIKALLEEAFPFIWISGEISNLRKPASGHCYFTLKDRDAQIPAVMFKGQNRQLTFLPEDGMTVTGFGRISVYSPRGAYQIILEYLEPAGSGALQAAFEQLKKKLAAEGLFADDYKKRLPFLPRKVAIISSASGAVVHDIIRVIRRRYANMPIDIIPAKVQGDGADVQIVAAIDRLNQKNDADVAIVARGGGSLEDMAAFNSETVARAIFASQIPIISAVGHETDFTIADFTADLRAPTPSAAAELAVPVKTEVTYTLQNRTRRLYGCLQRHIADRRRNLEKLTRRLVHPRRRIDDLKLRLDDQSTRLSNAFRSHLDRKRERLHWRTERLYANTPQKRILSLRETVERRRRRMQSAITVDLKSRRARLEALTGRLYALSPQAVLDRGYSITRSPADGTVVTDAETVSSGQELEIILARGALACRVERKDSDGEKDL